VALKPKRESEREREKRKWEVVCDTRFKRGVRAMFTAMKVPRQCPLVLLVKVGWRGGKTFGCEEGIGERWSRERS
jgi:hypothetical protein